MQKYDDDLIEAIIQIWIDAHFEITRKEKAKAKQKRERKALARRHNQTKKKIKPILWLRNAGRPPRPPWSGVDINAPKQFSRKRISVGGFDWDVNGESIGNSMAGTAMPYGDRIKLRFLVDS